jgi:type IX secretion system PorP/SprF family membrane protein
MRFIQIILFLALPTGCIAQQYALHSQYIFNLFMINPAYAGARDALSTNLSYRTQWVGFEGAPKTQTFSVHSPVKKQNTALGALVQNDVIGARQTTYAAFTYAYKLKIKRREYISFGLQGGIMNYYYNWSKLDYERPNDPAAYADNGSTWVPNFDFGIMYLSPRSYVGFSATSLNGAKINSNASSDARLDMHLNFMAGKVYDLNKEISLKPSLLIRTAMDGPIQFDANIGALINNTLWLTATYRYQFGMVYSAHCTVLNRLNLGYAFDLALNGLLAKQSGTHEIFLGYDFNIYRVKSTSPKYF